MSPILWKVHKKIRLLRSNVVALLRGALLVDLLVETSLLDKLLQHIMVDFIVEFERGQGGLGVRQNICIRVRFSSKFDQEKKHLITAFAKILITIEDVLFSERRLSVSKQFRSFPNILKSYRLSSLTLVMQTRVQCFSC